MVRPRNLAHRGGDHDGAAKDPRLLAKRALQQPKKGAARSRMSSPWVVFAASATVAFVAFLGYRGYLETRVNTPFWAPRVVDKSGLADPDRFWGSYRPGVYFGMKTRSPRDLLAGLMWFIPDQVKQNNLGFRHWCDQGDQLDTFGWTSHDGETFGMQEIMDRSLKLTTSFVKRPDERNGGDWTARIKVEETKKSQSDRMISLFFYAGMDEAAEGDLNPELDAKQPRILREIQGRTDVLGKFKLKFVDNGKVTDHFHAAINSPGPHKFTDSVMQHLRLHDKSTIGLDSKKPSKSEKANLVVYQVNGVVPFELDVVFESESASAGRQDELSGDVYTTALNFKTDTFNRRFENTFALSQKGFNSSEINFAKAALSNMIGGIGYFYGHSVVRSDLSSGPVKYWDAPLLTAVPSRSFFPRGFLWDEGFHNLLISKWSGRISADILGHWMDLVNAEGWIPREQILGLEARAKVPDEFVVQHNQNANPPTLLLTLQSMTSDARTRLNPAFKEFLQRMWTRLEVWYNWFNTTQVGKVPGTFRWRGRNATATRELNPKTLTSGLDDFPRASHPSEDERHVDLRCWMALAAKVMADVAEIVGRKDEASRYASTFHLLSDNSLLSDAHWSREHGAFLDYGLHTEAVKLERPPRKAANNPQGGNHPQGQSQEKIRVVSKEPQLQFVNEVGYVSLFPFLLELLTPDSPHLEKVLQDLEDPDKLHTPFGLRSLAKSASLYMKRNTEHDAPYWRGPIWININFLAVRALHHYSNAEGPHQARARQVYERLRAAVVGNVMREYYRTGYVWEQYNDKTGEGQGCRPFTGWSALVVLMMGEKY